MLRTLALLLPLAAAAETRHIVAQTYYRTFNRAYPVLARIQPGDVVVTETLDSGGQDKNNAHRSEPGNPLTGPFFIEGAEPGDALVIRLRKVRLNRNWGYSGYRLGLFALTPESIEGLYPANYKPDLIRKGSAGLVPWDIDRERNLVRLREPSSKRIRLEFPARPMLGCIGVAPAGDFAPTSGPAGAYGGNLDYNQIREGSTVILPVYHPGGLLYIGDGHALQADGEPLGNGIETSFDVEFSTEVRKQAALSGPRVETAEDIISVGAQAEFQSPLDRALQIATADMVRWLTTDYGLEPWAAHLLIAFQGRYDVITVAGSMGLKIDRKLLPKAAR
ncbi:MAG: acetamidase [Acidobacteria bacterium]|nr:acetamidase [Acidobacteriota bacterium]